MITDSNTYSLPVDFVFSIREHAYATLHDWLEGAGAPAEVTELLRAFSSLATPAVADSAAVTQAARAIDALGGAFDGPSTSGISHVKERAQAWAAAH